MKTTRKLWAGLGICLALPSLSGCAWLSPHTVETRTKTLRTWEETRPARIDGSPALATQFTDDGEHIIATLSRPVTCLEKTVVLKETQAVEIQSPPWATVGFLLAGSAIGLGTGGYLIGTAFDRPDIESAYSRSELSMQGSLGIGLPLIGAGITVGSLALWAIVQAGDEPQIPRTTESVEDESSRSCGRVGLPGARLEIRTWNGDTLTLKTDAAGQATFEVRGLSPDLPPSGEDWATISVVELERDGEDPGSSAEATSGDAVLDFRKQGPDSTSIQPLPINPPASVFATAVAESASPEQYERFRQRFPGSTEWKRLEEGYRALQARLEAEREREQAEKELAAQKAEEARREAFQGTVRAALSESRRLARSGELKQAYEVLSIADEHEGDPLVNRLEAERRKLWKRMARRALRKARRLARKGRWRKTRDLLDAVVDPPDGETGKVLFKRISDLRLKSVDRLEASKSSRPAYNGIQLGMTKNQIRRQGIKMRCDPPVPSGQRCWIAPMKAIERKHKAVFIDDRLEHLEVNFRENWSADFARFIKPYIERLGAPSRIGSIRKPPGLGSRRRGLWYTRIASWLRPDSSFIVSCWGRRPAGKCKAYGVMMMGNEEDALKTLIEYGE